jgi:hypothetical protein
LPVGAAVEEQIKALASKFGVQPIQVEAGLGAILGLIQSKAPAQYAQLKGFMPMAQQWIQKAAAMPTAGGDAGGGLLGVASGMLGKMGAAGGVGQVISQLQNAGFKPESALQFVPAALNQLKAMLGPEKFEQLLTSVPALKDALSGGAAASLKNLAGGLLGKFGGGKT